MERREGQTEREGARKKNKTGEGRQEGQGQTEELRKKEGRRILSLTSLHAHN